MRFKFASFNVENLFDRPKVFLMDDFQNGDVKLKKISQLQGLIDRSTYTTANKTKMVSLYRDLKDVVEIVESHQKLWADVPIAQQNRVARIRGCQPDPEAVPGSDSRSLAAEGKVVHGDRRLGRMVCVASF